MVPLDTSYTRDPRNARNARGRNEALRRLGFPECVVPGEIGSLGVGEVRWLFATDPWGVEKCCGPR